jgi:hypothetical protein
VPSRKEKEMKISELKHPMQPIGWDETGKVIRFKANKIVRMLLDTHKLNLNDLAVMDAQGQFNDDDYTQLMQLIGYSVSGYGDLSTSPEEIVEKADEIAAELSRQRKTHLVFATIVLTILVFIASYFIAAPCAANRDPYLDNAKGLVKSVKYIKDTRTGLCFAVYHFYRHSAITRVPCNTPVKFHIVRSGK